MSSRMLMMSDYGLIGNHASLALVSRLGSIEWCCFPYLDSPSHFGALVDESQGGRFQIQPACEFRSEQRYLPRTHVLETSFETPQGRATLVDWMPMEDSLREVPVLFRRLEAIEGTIPWLLHCSPRFGYGAHAGHAEPHRGGVQFRGPEAGTVARMQASGIPPLEIASGRHVATARFELEAGRSAHFSWSWGRRERLPREPSPDATAEAWREWAHHCPEGGCLFAGPWHDAVTRSALTIKILTHSHSGSIAESATTSLPGTPGTSRGFDHRYAWLRDGANAIQALAHLGCREESADFFLWLSDLIARDGAAHLQPVYTVDGGRSIPEQELPFLAGYQGSRPVRIGNHAARQFQLEVYGHILLAAAEYERNFRELPAGLWPHLHDIADTVCQSWRRPDHGPWENRAKPEHYVASKAMCWAALDRAIGLAERLKRECPPRWRESRQVLHKLVCDQGYDEMLGSFTRSFGTRDLDASVLQLPLIGFLPIEDPRIQSTLLVLQEKLSQGILLRRSHSNDDPSAHSHEGTHESAPLVSSFLMVSCLALSGNVDEASDRLAELCTHATPLGLFGEQIRLETGETTGNFPSAAVHLGLVNAALAVGHARALHRGEQLPLPGLPRDPDLAPGATGAAHKAQAAQSAQAAQVVKKPA